MALKKDDDRRDALQSAIQELARQRDEIARQRAELARLRGSQDPIAVVGMACRMPGAASPDELWALLERGGDAVAEVPRDRWNAGAYYDADPAAPGKMSTRQGAFVDGVAEFDPQFFGIAPREAQNMDPQQRLLLEVAWEALEHANIAPTDLYGTSTGVFVGITCFDHAIRISRNLGNFNAYAGTGSALNMAPGRLSYVLGVTGPSMAVDTACSSSLVCLHLACQSLRSGESDLALAGGVHLMLSPEVMVSFSQARMLAADGRSKTFDASADGYARGEGCGVVVLRRYADALASGDRILGLIRGTAVNQDGPSGGLTVPNGASQQQVIRRALEAAGIAPGAVGYVEAHGTGTPLGDPIEVEALARVYGEGRPMSDPLRIGSVKTNIGHLEPAAGMAALIKVLLSLGHESLPAHLHFRTPNPHIPWDTLPVRVTARAEAWPRGASPRLAGISAFGFSGTNAHVIVAEPPAPAASVGNGGVGPHLLPLSAKTEPALAALAARYAQRLEQADAEEFAAVAFTAGAGRAHFSHRLAVIAASAGEARAALETFAAGKSSPHASSGKAAGADFRRDAKDVKARLDAAYGTLADPAADRGAALGEVASLYLEGVAIDWPRLHGGAVRVSLPTYPFQRQRYWIETEPADPAAVPATAARRYVLDWAALGPVLRQGDRPSGRTWAIVVADAADAADAALGAALRARLTAQGDSASRVSPAEAASAGASDIIVVADARGPEEASRACVELLSLVQGVLASGTLPRLAVVTRGAMPVGGVMTEAGAAMAPVAAFTRVVGLEHPELAARVIDLGDVGDLDAAVLSDDAAAIVGEILGDEAEDQIAIRAGTRFGQRIEAIEEEARLAPPLRGDAAYLITGGLGRIGLQVARDFARRGARHLCLAGRNGVSTGEQRAALAAIEADGARVEVVTADAADRAAMTALVRDLSAGPGIAGVVHAAGMPGYVDISQMTAESVERVLRPKVQGAWILHELTRDLPLDFFVCFSSIASAWGSRGQAHYGAANAYLDALAHLRRAEGRPAVAINWGPWAGGGMTSPEAEALLRRVGIRPLPSAAAVDALASLASGTRAQVVVADIDWALFRGSYEARGHKRLLERIPVAGAAAAPLESELARDVLAAAPAARERMLADIIQREAAAVLDLPRASDADVTQGLFEMGMDSLMALELRTRLQTLAGRALPATLIFDYPTIGAIARFLLEEIAGRPDPGSTAPQPARETGAAIDALSDAEAEALLLKKLESIH